MIMNPGLRQFESRKVISEKGTLMASSPYDFSYVRLSMSFAAYFMVNEPSSSYMSQS